MAIPAIEINSTIQENQRRRSSAFTYTRRDLQRMKNGARRRRRLACTAALVAYSKMQKIGKEKGKGMMANKIEMVSANQPFLA